VELGAFLSSPKEERLFRLFKGVKSIFVKHWVVIKDRTSDLTVSVRRSSNIALLMIGEEAYVLDSRRLAQLLMLIWILWMTDLLLEA